MVTYSIPYDVFVVFHQARGHKTCDVILSPETAEPNLSYKAQFGVEHPGVSTSRTAPCFAGERIDTRKSRKSGQVKEIRFFLFIFFETVTSAISTITQANVIRFEGTLYRIETVETSPCGSGTLFKVKLQG